MLTVGSLFAGIGGFDYGLERAGMRSVWQCEINPFALRVLEKHWPHVLRVPDIRDLGAGTAPRVDVICGGFPCQDISLAGAGAGIDGERSGLWAEMFRVIRELQPRYVVVENVAALLARGLDRVLRDLAAGGFDAEWDCLPASAFGAPHRRDRVWLVAYSDHHRREGQPSTKLGREHNAVGWRELAGGDGLPQPLADTDEERCPQGLCEPAGGSERSRSGDAVRRGEHLADADAPSRDGAGSTAQAVYGPEAVERLGRCGGVQGAVQDADGGALQSWRVGGRAAQAGGPEWWAVEPPVGRVAHGVPDRLDQLAALGNALVPQIAEWLGRRILEWEGVEL